jgi:hypothetical protein
LFQPIQISSSPNPAIEPVATTFRPIAPEEFRTPEFKKQNPTFQELFIFNPRALLVNKETNPEQFGVNKDQLTSSRDLDIKLESADNHVFSPVQATRYFLSY